MPRLVELMMVTTLLLPTGTNSFVQLLPAVSFHPASSSSSSSSSRTLENTVLPATTTTTIRKGHLANHCCSRPLHRPRRTIINQADPSQVASVSPATNDVIDNMERWLTQVTPSDCKKRSISYKVSMGTTVPEILSDFWKVVSDAMDEHKAIGETKPMRTDLMFVLPYCDAVGDFKVLDQVNEYLLQCAKQGSCYEFGGRKGPISIMHYHPNFKANAVAPKPPTSSSSPSASSPAAPPAAAPRMNQAQRGDTRHSPYPSFSVNIFYKDGPVPSGAVKLDKPLKPKPTRRSPDSQPPSREEVGEMQEWMENARLHLEHLYNKAAAPSVTDKMESHGAPKNDIPESSQQVMQATQQWVKKMLQESQASASASAEDAIDLDDGEKETSTMSPGWPVEMMSNVGQFSVVRSDKAENIYADVWEAVVELVGRASDAGCAVPAEEFEGASIGDPSIPPCHSSIVVTPDFQTFNAHAFRNFADTILRGLQNLPQEDQITLDVFHPEWVSTGNVDVGKADYYRRAPYPSLHLRYNGLQASKSPTSGGVTHEDGGDGGGDSDDGAQVAKE